jgi:hypothetical protein
MRPQPGFAAINYSAYGLRAGAFTRDLPTAFRGRDGVRSAMDDYSGPRVMVLTDLEL